MKKNINEERKTLKNILERFYSGESCIDIVRYIYDNNLMSKIDRVIDSVSLSDALDNTSIIILSHIKRMYIKRHSYNEQMILDFLEKINIEENTEELDFNDLTNNFKYTEIPSYEYFKTIVRRFINLGIIGSNYEGIIKDYYEYLSYAEKEFQRKRAQYEERQKDDSLRRKILRYKSILCDLEKLYNNGATLAQINRQLDVNSEQFYHDIHNNVELFNDFTIKVADYRYELYLRKKYINDIICPNGMNINDWFEKIYKEYKRFSYEKLKKRVDTYLSESPLVTDNMRKYLIWLKKSYAKFYENKLVEGRNNSDKKRYDKLFESYEDIVIGFINSDETEAYLYCVKNKIDIKLFNKALEELANSDNERYSKYKEFINNYWAQKRIKYTNIANIVIAGCRKGVEDNNSKRDFDIIDYYSLTKIPPEEIFDFVKYDLRVEDYDRFLRFVSKNPIRDNLSDHEIEVVLSGSHFINIKFNDENGNQKNFRVCVTTDQKYEALKTLSEMNIPVNETTYDAMVKRIINNDFNNLKKSYQKTNS